MARLFKFTETEFKEALEDKRLLHRFDKQDEESLPVFMDNEGFHGVHKISLNDAAMRGDREDVAIVATLYQKQLELEYHNNWMADWDVMKKVDEAAFYAHHAENRNTLEQFDGNPLRHAVLNGLPEVFDDLVAKGYKSDSDLAHALIEEAIQFSPERKEQHMAMMDKVLAAGADPTSTGHWWREGEETPLTHAKRLEGHRFGDVAQELGVAMKREALANTARDTQSRTIPDSDLASPDEALSRRSRGRRM